MCVCGIEFILMVGTPFGRGKGMDFQKGMEKYSFFSFGWKFK
jgi:hypothetical protein